MVMSKIVVKKVVWKTNLALHSKITLSKISKLDIKYTKTFARLDIKNLHTVVSLLEEVMYDI